MNSCKVNVWLGSSCWKALLALFGFLAWILSTSSGAATVVSGEYRGLWVDAWGPGFLNSEQTTQLVQDARKYHFNALFVQMRRRGDAFYMPAAPNLEARTTAIANDYDALADLIAKAHTGSPRLEVHCWVPANLVWSGASNPSQAGHVVNRHPEYLMKNSSGETFIAEGQYLDPGHPDAMEWNFKIALDIVHRYEIDGFHWDYIRYPQQDSGYNEVALQRYRAEFFTATTPSPSDPRFSAWRRRQISDFLRWANSELLAIRPALIISAAVFANRTDAFNHRFQDWAAWNKEGLIDLCIPMNYTSDITDVFVPRLDDATRLQGARWVVMGIGAYLNTKENSVSQLELVRSRGLPGAVYYSYRTPNSGPVNAAETMDYVAANFQPNWRSTPSLPWKASPTRGIVKGTVRRSDTGEPVYNASVNIQANGNRSQRTESHGHFAFFETSPGAVELTATLAGFAPATAAVQARAGHVVHADIWITNSFDLPVTITRLDVSIEGAVVIQASGAKDVRYALQQSLDLREWIELTNTVASSSLVRFTNHTSISDATFYRIQILR